MKLTKKNPQLIKSYSSIPKDILKEIDSLGCRPGNTKELKWFDKRFPKEKLDKTIIALADSVIYSYDNLKVSFAVWKNGAGDSYQEEIKIWCLLKPLYYLVFDKE